MEYRIITPEYREALKRHWPEFVKQVASHGPSAVFVTYNSALPFKWLLERTWEPLGFGTPPHVSALASLKNYPETEDKERYERRLSRLVQKLGISLRPESPVIVLDDISFGSTEIKKISAALKRAGAQNTLGEIFTAHSRDADIRGPQELPPPPWYGKIKLLRRSGKIKALVGEMTDADRQYIQQLHLEINALAMEISGR